MNFPDQYPETVEFPVDSVVRFSHSDEVSPFLEVRCNKLVI